MLMEMPPVPAPGSSSLLLASGPPLESPGGNKIHSPHSVPCVHLTPSL